MHHRCLILAALAIASAPALAANAGALDHLFGDKGSLATRRPPRA
jgi:hypothetical protein